MPSGKTAINIACGVAFTIVLFDDGSVYGCGNNTSGQLGNGTQNLCQTLTSMENMPSGKIATKIACGSDFTIVLFNDGSVFGCGNNGSGQLGIDTSNSVDNNIFFYQTLTQMAIQNGKTTTHIACGYDFTIILFNDGTVYGCGNNSSGQLGINSTTSQTTLTQMTIQNGNIARNIACGNDFTIVLFDDGSVYGCGNNSSSQLNSIQNSYQTLTLMENMPSGKTATKIACGHDYTLILYDNRDNTNSIYGCGDNSLGQLGNGTSNFILNRMIMPNLNPGVFPVKVARGPNFTIVLFNDGSIYGCGDNTSGQLGNGTYTSYQIVTPMTNMPSGKKAINIACGYDFTIVLFDDGTVYGCGNNDSGQLGINSITYQQNTLTQMINSDGTNVINAKNIACGSYHTVVLFSDDTVSACGYNSAGQLGINSTTFQIILKQMVNSDGTNVTNAINIACGSDFTIVLFDNGSIYGCGNNSAGQLGNDKYGSCQTLNLMVNMQSGKTVTNIACGTNFTIILYNDGSIYGCGDNSSGQLSSDIHILYQIVTSITNMPSGKTVTNIACGYNFTIILFNDGSVYGCGDNFYGPLGRTNNSETLEQMNYFDTNNNTIIPFNMASTAIFCVILFDPSQIQQVYNGSRHLSLNSSIYNIYTYIQNQSPISIIHSTATFIDINAGTNKPVAINILQIKNTNNNNTNYVFVNNLTTTGTITPLPLTGSFNNTTKIYNGNTNVNPLFSFSPNNIISGDTVNISNLLGQYNSKYVQNANTINITGTSSNQNYLFTITTTPGTITPLPLTGSFKNTTKIYNGNTKLSKNFSFTPNNIIRGDTVKVINLTGQYNNKTTKATKIINIKGTSTNKNYLFNITSIKGSITKNNKDIPSKEIINKYKFNIILIRKKIQKKI